MRLDCIDNKEKKKMFNSTELSITLRSVYKKKGKFIINVVRFGSALAFVINLHVVAHSSNNIYYKGISVALREKMSILSYSDYVKELKKK